MAAHLNARIRGFVTFANIDVLRSLLRPDDSAIIAQEKQDKEILAGLKARFLAAAKTNGVACTLDCGDGPASELLLWASRLHDLTIVEQRDERKDELGYDPAEETALGSGRPVLIVPRTGRFIAAPKHILLAWNGSRQAAAALQGALPIIHRANKVTVCTGIERNTLRPGVRVPAIDIRSHLAQHVPDVAVETVEIRGDDVGRHLLERANELVADLLVMGVYGRSWFSEAILGGATRHVFHNMTVPVLTGH
jgi:nucleotide-binding universal stress UspA family protein